MRLKALLSLLVLAVPAAAQSPEDLVLPRLIDSLCINLVEAQSGCETAVLLASENAEDSADLVIVSDRRVPDLQSTLITARGIAYSGTFFGQSPSLEASASGALLLHEEQIAVGRTPWMQTLTIQYLDDGFLVVGQSYSSYDRLSGGGFSCDVNLLTGDWTTSADRMNPESGETTYDVSHSGTIAPARQALSEWSPRQGLPAPCETALTAWFNADTL